VGPGFKFTGPRIQNVGLSCEQNGAQYSFQRRQRWLLSCDLSRTTLQEQTPCCCRAPRRVIATAFPASLKQFFLAVVDHNVSVGIQMHEDASRDYRIREVGASTTFSLALDASLPSVWSPSNGKTSGLLRTLFVECMTLRVPLGIAHSPISRSLVKTLGFRCTKTSSALLDSKRGSRAVLRSSADRPNPLQGRHRADGHIPSLSGPAVAQVARA